MSKSTRNEALRQALLEKFDQEEVLDIIEEIFPYGFYNSGSAPYIQIKHCGKIVQLHLVVTDELETGIRHEIETKRG